MTKENKEICECGHLEIEHAEYGCRELSIEEDDIYCPCKKFKLKK